MKKFMCVLIAAMLFCMTACGNDSNEGGKKQTDTTTESGANGEVETSEKKTEEVSTEEPTTVDKEALKAQQNAELKEKMEQIKVSVLAKATVPYEDAMLNGYGFYSEDYETATAITLLVEFPDEELYDDYKNLSVTGDAVIGPDGEPVPNTYTSAGWKSSDEKYLILIMRVAGEVDPTTIGVEVKCAIYEKDPVYVQLPFENGGNEVGFDYAVQCFGGENASDDFDSRIIKIQSRHYFVYGCPRPSSYSRWSQEEGDVSGNVYEYAIVPLEGGFTKTLTTADATVVCDVAVENTGVKVTVNEKGKVDGAPKFQTVIAADVYRVRTEEELAILDGDDEDARDEVFDKGFDDRMEVIGGTSVGFDDGDGNMIYFTFD